jgi:hypothetical protein
VRQSERNCSGLKPLLVCGGYCWEVTVDVCADAMESDLEVKDSALSKDLKFCFETWRTDVAAIKGW